MSLESASKNHDNEGREEADLTNEVRPRVPIEAFDGMMQTHKYDKSDVLSLH